MLQYAALVGETTVSQVVTATQAAPLTYVHFKGTVVLSSIALHHPTLSVTPDAIVYEVHAADA